VVFFFTGTGLDDLLFLFAGDLELGIGLSFSRKARGKFG
jgi:hypothetical protein